MVKFDRSKKGTKKGFQPKKAAQRAADAKTLSLPEKREVARMIRGAGELKTVCWYSGGSNPLGAGGRAGWAWEPHNGAIQSNTTDIMRLIPLVLTGTGDNQRIGDRITPVSLTVHGNVKFSYTNVNLQQAPQNYFVVIYVLQHVALKTYQSLQSASTTPPTGGNDFNQLLKTGEGDTTAFTGLAYQADLPVSTEYYRVLSKKIVPLRISGIVQAPSGGQAGGSLQSFNNNSAQLCARYSFNLSKKIPATLKYPETAVTTGNPGDPTNASPFMCMGFYSMDYDGATQASNISNEYVSVMNYKDL